ncbi:MAG: energy-coupling factor ABC transporter ATP-binding protein [Candidatus Marinimicrobia bacterium]|nr:energy-coupling factor ABC transporter ATP-binding protein [Candidatus Neomarinimicrobiota bacterium]
MISISIHNLIFYYENSSDFELRIDNMKIQVDGIVGIVGDSGSGKTTFVKLLAGLEKPRQGVIIFNHSDCNSLYIPQFPEKILIGGTVKKSVSLIFKNKKNYDKSIDLFKSILSFFDINYLEIMNRFGFELSMGELRKLAISMGIAANPNLLILDEPSVGLDWQSKSKLEKLLKEQIHGNVIIASHDRNFIDRVCDDIYLIDNGTILLPMKKKEDRVIQSI